MLRVVERLYYEAGLFVWFWQSFMLHLIYESAPINAPSNSFRFTKKFKNTNRYPTVLFLFLYSLKSLWSVDSGRNLAAITSVDSSLHFYNDSFVHAVGTSGVR